MIENGGHRVGFQFQALKANIKGVFNSQTITMVTCYVARDWE